MDEERKLDGEKLQKRLDSILFELRWIQRNMNPPVNYAALIIVSIVVSVVTTIVITSL